MGKAHKTTIGGQALMEGIMMRSTERTAAVVRTRDGLVTKEETNKPPRFKWLKFPFIRGVPGFVGSLRLGMSLLFWSAEFQMEDDAPPSQNTKTTPKKTSAPNTETPTETPTNTAAAPPAEMPKYFMALTMGLALILALGLFTILPTFLGGLLAPRIGDGFWRNLVETLIRFTVLLLYMFFVSRQKDIQRTFSYHGAEHKAIACYEAGQALTIGNVRGHTRFHPRCGTSFLLTVVIISLFTFMLASYIFPFLPWDNPFLRILFRLLLLPIVVSISYEFNRLVGRYDNPFTILFRTPGLLLQRFTTIEPDDGMIEVAIEALERVRPKDGVEKW